MSSLKQDGAPFIFQQCDIPEGLHKKGNKYEMVTIEKNGFV